MPGSPRASSSLRTLALGPLRRRRCSAAPGPNRCGAGGAAVSAPWRRRDERSAMRGAGSALRGAGDKRKRYEERWVTKRYGERWVVLSAVRGAGSQSAGLGESRKRGGAARAPHLHPSPGFSRGTRLEKLRTTAPMGVTLRGAEQQWECDSRNMPRVSWHGACSLRLAGCNAAMASRGKRYEERWRDEAP